MGILATSYLRAAVAASLHLPERHPGRTVAAIGCLFALAYAVALVGLAKPGGRIVMGDALGHYVQLRSAVFDRDLQFRNDYARLYGIEEGSEVESALAADRTTTTGHTRNLMPVGPAILWAPAFLLAVAGVWLIDLLGAGYPLDGFAPAFQAAAGFSGIAAATAGSWLAYLTAARLFGARTAIWATLIIWLSSSALYYSLISPAYSHSASMLAVSAFWFIWTRTRDRQDVPRYALVGATIGIAALMRWQDAVLLLVPALDVAWHSKPAGIRASATRIAACGAAAAVAFAPQMAVWMVLYGRPFTVPQGSGFMKWHDPALWAVLMSDNHGLISWTPVIALALAGLVPLTRRLPLVGIAAIACLVVSWYVNAAVWDWWGGEAFGARRFLSCYPVFILGTAALFDRVRLRTAAMALVTLVFVGYTGLLLLQYQTFMHGLRHLAPYPRGFVDLYLWRFRTPIDLAAWWLR
jgi:hypothetical protein